MAKLYPRKQTVIIFLVCAVLVSLAMIYNSFQYEIINSQNSEASVALIPKESAKIIENPVITDGSDWKAQFTENTAPVSAPKSSPKVTESQKLTMTDQLGRSIFAKYIDLKQTGLINDQETLGLIADNVANTSLNSLSPKKYSESNIIVTTNDLESYKKFSAFVGSTFSLYTAKQNEAVIAKNAIMNNDLSQLKSIDPIIRNYDKILATLLSIKTPSDLVRPEVDLVNGVSTMKFVAENLRAAEKDPLRGMIAVNSYLGGVKQIIDALSNINNSLTAKGVSFDLNRQFLAVLLNHQ